MKGTPIERFEHYAHRIPEHDCWEWCGSLRPQKKLKGDGYGCLLVDGRLVGAHRFAYEHFNGPIPAGHHVLHACDNPSCVNPAHLFTGTVADNMHDRDDKGRNVGVGRLRKHAKKARRLTDKEARFVRKAVAAGALQRDMAVMFGVSQPAISYIVRGKTYKPGGDSGKTT